MDAQIELRQHVWKRNGWLYGQARERFFPRLSEFTPKHILPNYGFGYRWEFKKRVNVRLDLGLANTRPDLFLTSMKLFKNIKNWLENQEHLFYLFLFILIVPNMVLCFTEPLPFMAKSRQRLVTFRLLLPVDDFCRGIVVRCSGFCSSSCFSAPFRLCCFICSDSPSSL